MKASDVTGKQVLEGIRVIDFSRIFAGPDAAQTLGDLGADVVKVEDPDGGDGCRTLGIVNSEFAGYSPAFRSFNRNKRSITLNLGTDAGREVAARLIEGADVVINNFRPGTMDRWGLGYERMAAANPRLVYGDFYAFGDRGPMASIGANDLQLQAHSGLMSITGPADGPPNRAGSAIVDLHAGMALVAGILAALLQRATTGRGQRVETSLLRSSAHLMGYLYQEYWSSGYVHRAMGTANHLSVPNQAYPSRNGYVIIIAPTDEMWGRCVEALEAHELKVPAFATAAARLRNRVQLEEALSAVTRRFDSAQIEHRLAAAKVNVAIVRDIAEAADHLQLEAIDAILHSAEEEGVQRYIATPFKLSDSELGIRRRSPKLGEHTAEILAELGYDGHSVERLRFAGAL